MTAAEIVESYAHAIADVTLRAGINDTEGFWKAIARRDAIKAALAAALEGALTYRCEPPCKQTDEYGECQPCREWRKLEEACRG